MSYLFSSSFIDEGENNEFIDEQTKEIIVQRTSQNSNISE